MRKARQSISKYNTQLLFELTSGDTVFTPSILQQAQKLVNQFRAKTGTYINRLT